MTKKNNEDIKNFQRLSELSAEYDAKNKKLQEEYAEKLSQIRENSEYKPINKVQDLMFELMRNASFNSFNGHVVVDSLIKHRDLWEGVIMDGDGVKLRDISQSHWNVDTVYIIPVKGKEDELMKLAKTWRADEVNWMKGREACTFLGSWSMLDEKNNKHVLTVWWD